MMYQGRLFKNRQEAGSELAESLEKFKGEDGIVLALPRGGLPIGFEVAKFLGLPLSVVVSRKIGLPGNEEFGIGAISEGGVKILDEYAREQLYVSAEQLDRLAGKELKELERRIQLYRQGKDLPDLSGKTAILIDDGLATGVTAKAAIAAINKKKPAKIIFASPVCARDTVGEISKEVDKLVCLHSPEDFLAVGFWYEDFAQISDQEVVNILKESESLKQKEKAV